MPQESSNVSDNIKFATTALVVYLFFNSFPFYIFIFATGIISGMWVSNKYPERIPLILDYLKVDDNINLTCDFMRNLYIKSCNLSDTLGSKYTSTKSNSPSSPINHTSPMNSLSQ